MSGPQPPLLRLALRFRTEIFFAALVAALFGDYLFSDKILYGSDSIPSGLFFRGLLVDFVKEFHELPRWNPYILGGLPFLDATHGDTFFPSSLLQFVMPVYRALGHKLILHVFLAGVFMAFYLRTLRLHASAVTVGALAYMLSPVLVSYIFAGQDGKMYVTSLTPLVFGMLERAMRSGSARSFVGLGLCIGLLILSAQIQMAYHCMWFLGALFLVRLARGPAAGGTTSGGTAPGGAAPGRGRVTALFAAAVGIGLLTASVQLLPAVAYVKHPAGFSVRSDRTDYEHAQSWSLHPEELASMAVPEFCNAPRGYWGRNIFKYNSDYVGVLTVLLAVLAMTRRRDATRWYLAGLAAFAVLYAMGGHTPLHRLFYAVVPQVKLFRAPPLVMFGAAFGLCALAALAVHDLETAAAAKGKRPERAGGRLLAWGLGSAGVLALAGLAASGVTAFWTDLFKLSLDAAKQQAQAANLPAFRGGALIAAAVLAAGTFAVHARRRGAMDSRTLLIALVVLTVFDLWRVDRRFKMVTEPDRWIRPDALVGPLSAEAGREKFRVAPAAYRYALNELGYFGVESTDGFHDNELAWYRELRTAPETENLLRRTEATGYPFLRILNVKYILHEQAGLPNPLPVEGALPRFRLADAYEVILDRAAIPARIADPSFDPARTVILEEDPVFPPGSGDTPPGRITGYRYLGNEITAQVEVDRPCLLVHAENWFPYWRATVDGAEAPILRAYGVIRAIPLAPGRHEVDLRFVSEPFELGKRITGGTLLAAALALALGARRRRRAE